MDLTFDQLPQAVSNLASEVNEIKQLLLEKSSEFQSSEADELLTVEQAAEMLCLSVPTIYGHTHRAEIPVCKQGKRLYFLKKDLIDWVKAGRKKTLADSKAEAELYLKKKGGRRYE